MRRLSIIVDAKRRTSSVDAEVEITRAIAAHAVQAATLHPDVEVSVSVAMYEDSSEPF